MTFTHHTRSRSEWLGRFERRLGALTSGKLHPVRYFQLACETYETCYDQAPETAAAMLLRQPEHEEHDVAIAAYSSIFWLRKFSHRSP